MLSWLQEHSQAISAVTGLGTLGVWLIYLQVFVSNYRRQLRAKILISRGAGSGLESRCLVSNMSAAPVYIQSVIVTLDLDGERLMAPVTDLSGREDDQTGTGAGLPTRQGPLASGELKDVGTFGNLVRHVLHSDGADDRGGEVDRGGEDEQLRRLRSVQIELLGVYASEDLPVGARRTFLASAGNRGIELKGQTPFTTQLRSRRDRKQLAAVLEHDR